MSIIEETKYVNEFNDLFDRFSSIFTKEETDLFREAYMISLMAYEKHIADTGGDKIYKSLIVTKIVALEMELDKSSMLAALLQDSVRTDYCSIDDIKKKFGSDVSQLISGLQKIASVETKNITLQADNFRNLLLSMTEDVRVIFIKLANRLHQIRDINKLHVDDRLEKANETYYLYAPIAHRLGLYKIKTDMEDLSMKFMHNKEYKEIASKLQQTKDKRNKYINDFIAPLKEQLRKLGYKSEVKGRPKSIHSIWNKIKKQGVKFEEVYDLFAIRIIHDCPVEDEKADCWNIYSLVTDTYQPNPKRLRDWISAPKPNGYESLHTTVLGPEGKWVEVQIRTKRMDEVAEKGHASHFLYKEGGGANELDNWLSGIRNALEKPEEQTKSSTFKMELYSKDIFVFTPKGDLKKVKDGSTILDFAYLIHSNVGDKCTGAKVNGKIVPIKYTIINGDRVEILTSKNQSPTQNWLNIATTTRAKAKIRHSLSVEMNKSAVLGKEILERKLNQYNIISDEKLLHQIRDHFKVKSTIEFYSMIAESKIEIPKIKAFINSKDEKPDTSGTKVAADEFQLKQHESHKSSDYLVLDKISNIDYKLSKCCNPIFGDKIFGFVSAHDGTKIHRTDCPNAEEIIRKYPYRILNALWTDSEGEASFAATINVVGIDDIGIMNKITKVISNDLKLNVRSISIDSKDGLFKGNITIYVKDKYQLNSVVKQIQNLQGVIDVKRGV